MNRINNMKDRICFRRNKKDRDELLIFVNNRHRGYLWYSEDSSERHGFIETHPADGGWLFCEDPKELFKCNTYEEQRKFRLSNHIAEGGWGGENPGVDGAKEIVREEVMKLVSKGKIRL